MRSKDSSLRSPMQRHDTKSVKFEKSVSYRRSHSPSPKKKGKNSKKSPRKKEASGGNDCELEEDKWLKLEQEMKE